MQIRVRFLLLYFLMTDSIESAAQYVIEFHAAAASFFFIRSAFPIQFLLARISRRVMSGGMELYFPTIANLRD